MENPKKRDISLYSDLLKESSRWLSVARSISTKGAPIKHDFLGTELIIGQVVVYIEIDKRSLKRGEIIKITDKMVEIMPLEGEIKVKQYHNQIVVI